MKNENTGNVTRLVFCNQRVLPAVITSLLGLTPSSSYSVGDILNGRISEMGFWALELPGADSANSVELQLDSWLDLLRTKVDGFATLRESGYEPYLECKAEAWSLSLCISPTILAELGSLNIALSVWLYENEQSEH